MRPGLVTTFDLGYSCGLSDSVFGEDRRRAEAPIGWVALHNPLGRGIDVDLVDSEVLRRWRRVAVRQLEREEIELGPLAGGGPNGEFRAQLRHLLEHHPVAVCELVVHAVGTAFLRLELAAGIEPRHVPGVLACFEFAVYRPEVSDALLQAAQRELVGALDARPGVIQALTARPGPALRKDADGYDESDLIAAVTKVIRMADGTQPAVLAEVVEALGLENDLVEMPFADHGRLLYTWATCILVPRGAPDATPDDELARLDECLHIAHAAAGICEAFLRLAQSEIESQVEGFVNQRSSGRSTQELNRLRALALAVVNLTAMRRITQSDEDRRYFRQFQEDAGLVETQTMLTEAVDVLYQVQEAEMQEHRTSREYLLNAILVLLASLTLVSVTADAYNFVRGEDLLFTPTPARVRLLVEFILGLTLAVALLIWALRPKRGRRRSSRRARAGTGVRA